MKRKGLLAGILLLILMLLCSCGASEEAKEIDAQLQEQQAAHWRISGKNFFTVRQWIKK